MYNRRLKKLYSYKFKYRRYALLHIVDIPDFLLAAEDKRFLDIFGEEESNSFSEKSKQLLKLIQETVTERQYLYLLDYYGNRLTMDEISRKYHRNKTTIYRTILRALDRIQIMTGGI